MKIGTRSLLFGYHQFLLHPLLVAWSWWRLYGFPWDPRLWVAFLVHDWGYWGKPNMDGGEGEEHPWRGAYIMGWLFDPGFMDEPGDWFYLTLLHSRFYARRMGMPPSRLCWADKRVIAVTPAWLQVALMWPTGELKEYMHGGAPGRTQPYVIECNSCGERHASGRHGNVALALYDGDTHYEEARAHIDGSGRYWRPRCGSWRVREVGALEWCERMRATCRAAVINGVDSEGNEVQLEGVRDERDT